MINALVNDKCLESHSLNQEKLFDLISNGLRVNLFSHQAFSLELLKEHLNYKQALKIFQENSKLYFKQNPELEDQDGKTTNPGKGKGKGKEKRKVEENESSLNIDFEMAQIKKVIEESKDIEKELTKLQNSSQAISSESESYSSRSETYGSRYS